MKQREEYRKKLKEELNVEDEDVLFAMGLIEYIEKQEEIKIYHPYLDILLASKIVDFITDWINDSDYIHTDVALQWVCENPPERF